MFINRLPCYECHHMDTTACAICQKRIDAGFYYGQPFSHICEPCWGTLPEDKQLPYTKQPICTCPKQTVTYVHNLGQGLLRQFEEIVKISGTGV